ncbi:MAG: sigma factor [Gemmatimonadales bacterium]
MSPATLPVKAFAAGFDQYRPALSGYCYRVLGSVVDAEDAVQEAMLRAWKSVGRPSADDFAPSIPRASPESWMTTW